MDYETIKEHEVDEETMKRFTRVQEYTSRISHIEGTLIPDMKGIKEYYELNNIINHSINTILEDMYKELDKLKKERQELKDGS